MCYNSLKEDEKMHEGHRKRMLDRLKRDPAGLQDHELLEILLFFSVPRANTNPTAHDLISSFGSLKDVFCAGTFERLCEVHGIGESSASLLLAIGEVCTRLQVGALPMPQVFSPHTFRQFCMARYCNIREEIIELFCLDAQERITFAKRYTTHSFHEAELEPQEINDLFAAEKPRGLVIVHTHPGAPATPSREDDFFTRQMAVICSCGGVELYDHIIVGEGEPYSYLRDGKLEEIKSCFSREAIVKRMASF